VARREPRPAAWRTVRSLLVCAIAVFAVLSQQGLSGQGRSQRDVEGTLEVHVEDRPDGARVNYFLRTATEHIPLRFSGRGPDRRLTTGSRVRVRGTMSTDGLLELSSSGSNSGLTTVSLGSENTLGPQSTLVILFNFSNDSSQPFTAAAAQSVTFTDVSNFYLENSFGQTSVTGTVVGWYGIASPNTTCMQNTWASQAEAAATAAGVDVASFPRRVYAFPHTNACNWSGIGTVGGGTLASPSKAWINGTYSLTVVGHEMGHNLGLYHAHSNTCDATGCVTSDYGDVDDIKNFQTEKD